jgi:glycosyltransferase involved in cell wall biosynthesis
MFHLLRGLSRYHQINLLSYVEREDDLEHLPPLRQFCQKVKFVLRGQTFDAYNPFGLKPRQLTVDYGNPQMFQAIAGELSTGEYDLCQIEYLEIVAALPRDIPIPLILTHHELQFAAMLQAARLQKALSRGHRRKLLDALVMFNYEIEALKRFDAIVAMSQEDADAMRKFLPDLDVRISPMAVDTDYFTPQEGKGEPDSMMYTGYYEHYPNEDAVVYFVREIFPLIQRKVPNAKFYIVGSYPSSAVLELARVKNVMVTGRVEDLRPWLAKATIFVAPIRLGRGMRGKIPEAMAMRKPVVGSSVAFAGLEATDGKQALIADDPSDFAEKVIKLLKDSRLREEIAENGYALVRARYRWDVQVELYRELYASLVEWKGSSRSRNRIAPGGHIPPPRLLFESPNEARLHQALTPLGLVYLIPRVLWLGGAASLRGWKHS